MTSADVPVVGAGLAGLSCARALVARFVCVRVVSVANLPTRSGHLLDPFGLRRLPEQSDRVLVSPTTDEH